MGILQSEVARPWSGGAKGAAVGANGATPEPRRAPADRQRPSDKYHLVSPSRLGPGLRASRRGGAAAREHAAAFDHGLSLGADGLEFDVHLSRDGVVVVHHDPTLERTTNGRGPHRGADGGRARARSMPLRLLRRVADAALPFGAASACRGCARCSGAIPHAAHHRAEDEPAELAHTDDRRGARRRRARSRRGRVVRHARAARGAAPTNRGSGPAPSREETRWALYRSWVRWPLRRPAVPTSSRCRSAPARPASSPALRRGTPTAPACRCRCGP